MASFLAGAGFGAVLLTAGVYQPSAIVSQLKWQEWHMLHVLLTATASSAAVYTIAEKLGHVSLKPRSSSSVGLFSKYDGNIIGGSLLGPGMALAGSCPGTVLAQIGAGLSTGLYTLGGCVLGGLAYTGFIGKAVKSRNERLGIRDEPSTFGEKLGLSRSAAFLLFEIGCIAAIAGTALYGSKNPEAALLSVKSGLHLGAAQLFSLIIRKSMLGVSGSYEEIGKYFWWLVGGAPKPGSYQNILFGSGVAAGAWALASYAPSLVTKPALEVPPPQAMVGGVLMAIGSRVAGGCTSGHGISGMSLLSTSSVITIANTFLAGAIVAALAY